ncbi:MAG: hypothetical protein IKS91_01330 [Spirochaetia bacterium]|nr:hypothetical protein [Spirochaetia bacterium]
MKKLLFFSIVILICLLDSCTTTQKANKIESIEKPGTELNSYTNILISCDFDNLKYRKQLENEFYNQFSKNNIYAVKGLDLFPPLQSYSDSEKEQIIKENSIELIININDISFDSEKGDKKIILLPTAGLLVGRGKSRVIVTAEFDITITDIKNQETIFKGTATYEEKDRNISKCTEKIFKSLAEEMVNNYFVK